MPGGFVSEGNVLRLSPLAKAVASRQSGSANPTTGGVSNATLPQSGGMTPVDNAPPVQITEQELAALEERASQGDPEALSILEALGVLAGGAAAVGGGYALYKALQGRKRPDAVNAEPMTNAQPNSSSRAVQPHVTRVYEEVIPRPEAFIPSQQMPQLEAPTQRRLPSTQTIMRSLRK